MPFPYREFVLRYRKKHGDEVSRYVYALDEAKARDLWETSDYAVGATLLCVTDRGNIDTSGDSSL